LVAGPVKKEGNWPPANRKSEAAIAVSLGWAVAVPTATFQTHQSPREFNGDGLSTQGKYDELSRSKCLFDDSGSLCPLNN